MIIFLITAILWFGYSIIYDFFAGDNFMKQKRPLILEEGHFYQDFDGKIIGPMKKNDRNDWVPEGWSEGAYTYRRYKDNGTSYYDCTYEDIQLKKEVSPQWARFIAFGFWAEVFLLFNKAFGEKNNG